MKKLTILVVPFDAVGHVNACIGSTKPLLDRGHRVIFLVDEAYQGKLSPLGFEEYAVSLNSTEQENAGENWAKTLVELGVLGRCPLEEKHKNLIETFVLGDMAMESLKLMDNHTKKAIETFKPDLFFIDAVLPPCIYHSGIPWVNNMSLTPLALVFDESDNFPPTGSGFPSNGPRDETWHRFKTLNRIVKYSKRKNDFIEQEMGYPRFPNESIIPYQEALISLYACPEEYDYPDMRKLGWFNIEVFNKNFKGIPLEKLIPEKFLTDDLNGKWSGKWIYLSMGSMGSIDLELMGRLLDALGSTNHKLIVSKGPRHREYELPRNAWGDRFLPQTSLVPQIDLVITHGGNNTVTETFAQGVPMIVMPLFGDQYDNAQRLLECGLAQRLDPYEFTEPSQLVDSVNRLLYDEKLIEKLKKASQRILSHNRHEQLAERVEQLWAEKQCLNIS